MWDSINSFCRDNGESITNAMLLIAAILLLELAVLVPIILINYVLEKY